VIGASGPTSRASCGAVLLVVLFHAGVPHLTGGYVGVDVFFVISGFVITGLLLRERKGTGRTSILDFYARRVRRILPAATLVILVTVAACYLLLGVVSGNNTADDGRWQRSSCQLPLRGHWDKLPCCVPPRLATAELLVTVVESSSMSSTHVVPADGPDQGTPEPSGEVGNSTRNRDRLVLLALHRPDRFTPGCGLLLPFTRAWELALGP